MNHTDLTSRLAVFLAMEECRRIGRDVFLEKHGFRPSREYVLRLAGEEFDSKAILGVAIGYQYPDHGILKASDFSGGKSAAGRRLAQLGFEVDGVPVPAGWSLAEVEATVADYFDMLRCDIQDEPYSKSKHNERLRAVLQGRSKAAVELKHQNISAILNKLGVRWIRGYLPRGNAQLLLEAVVTDRIGEIAGELFGGSLDVAGATPALSVMTVINPPQKDLVEAVARRRRAVKVDFAEVDARNRKLGQLGEQLVLIHYRNKLDAAGRSDLAARVRWVSRDVGDGLGYDIEAFEDDGTPIFVEVKATSGPSTAPFLITANELKASAELGSEYVLCRVFDLPVSPGLYILRGDIREVCRLVPAVWWAVPAAP
jgi:hypothetical protein